jgi:hypothetical protein
VVLVEYTEGDVIGGEWEVVELSSSSSSAVDVQDSVAVVCDSSDPRSTAIFSSSYSIGGAAVWGDSRIPLLRLLLLLLPLPLLLLLDDSAVGTMILKW